MTQFRARRTAHVRVHHCTVFGAPPNQGAIPHPESSPPVITPLSHDAAIRNESMTVGSRRVREADGLSAISNVGKLIQEPVRPSGGRSASTPSFGRGSSRHRTALPSGIQKALEVVSSCLAFGTHRLSLLAP